MTPAEDAARRLDEALAEAGLEDPRPAFRALLLRIRERDPGAFREESERFEREVVPAVVSDETPALAAWTRYGAGLAKRLGPGRAVAVDPGGRARDLPAGGAPPGSSLVLHLPDDGSRALALLRPRSPSDAQRATEELLVG